MTFAEKLSNLRRSHNYTQEQFADLLGVSRQAVSRWEGETAYPETEKIIRISEMFDCSIDYLLKDSVEDPSPFVGKKGSPKRTRRAIAAVVLAIAVFSAALAVALIPRRATITVRSWVGADIEGDEYELTYKEIATSATYPTPESYYSNHIYGEWNLDGSGYGRAEFAVVDTKNIGRGTVGSSVYTDVRFDKLYLYDNNSGKWRIFKLVSYSDNTPAHLRINVDKGNGEYYKYYVG